MKAIWHSGDSHLLKSWPLWVVGSRNRESIIGFTWKHIWEKTFNIIRLFSWTTGP
jgi:hypothetical protein